MGNERKRRGRRVAVHGTVDQLQISDAQASPTGSPMWRSLDAALINVSKNGLQVVVREPVRAGSTVRLSLGVPPGAAVLGGRWVSAGSGKLREEGRIVHVGAEPDQPHAWRLGVSLPPSGPAVHDRTAVRALFLGVVLLLWYSLAQSQGSENTIPVAVAIAFMMTLGAAVELHHIVEIRAYPHHLAHWRSTLETALASDADLPDGDLELFVPNAARAANAA